MTFEIVPGLPTIRRIVTGHTPEGTSIFEHDDNLTPVNPIPKGAGVALSAGFTLIHRTQDYPVQIRGGSDELKAENLFRSKGCGIVCEVVDFPPQSNKEAPVYMHRNQSLDYLVILKGTINAILDGGVEKTLREGDVMVQKGTIHAWKNVSDAYCRFMTVIIPSERVKNLVTGEYLESDKIPGLSE